MPGSAQTKAYNDHNVYILGAGFAAEAGLPLIKDFMNRMRDAAAWLEQQGGREREIEAIERVLRFRLDAAAAAFRIPLDIENVEELFSLASASGGVELTNDMTTAIAATLDFARAKAPPFAEHQLVNVGMRHVPQWTKPAEWGPPPARITQQTNPPWDAKWFSCSPYEFYVGLMAGYFNQGKGDRRDTIITFNYDTLIEERLHHLKVPFDYGIPADSIRFNQSAKWIEEGYSQARVRILKLHGSVNWAGLPPESLERYRRGVEEMRVAALLDAGDLTKESFNKAPEPLSDLTNLFVYGDYAALRQGGVSKIPFLLPPTWLKSFTGHLSDVRDQAVSALSTATSIIIVGYSLPATDQHFRYLLAAGLQNNISLRRLFFVNPGLKEQPTKRELEGKLLTLFREEHLGRGIIEPIPASTREFFEGADSSRISYRIRINRPLNPPEVHLDPAQWGSARWVASFSGGDLTVA